MPSVPGRADVGFGCCFQEGVLGAFPGVFPEKVFLRARLVVVPLFLLPPLEGRVVLMEVSLDGLVVLLGVHRGQGAAQCGVDVLWGGGAWGCGGAVWVWLLSLVFRVLVCGGRGGYGAWWHGVVGLLRFCGLLVGLWAPGCGY